MSGESEAPQPADSGTRRWALGLGFAAALLGTFLVVGAIGAHEAARSQRVLSFLAPIFDVVRQGGKLATEWWLAHARAVGWSTTGVTGVLLLGGFLVAWRRAAPLVWLAAAVSLATWGQVLLLENVPLLGGILYGGGIACAIALGIGWPMRRLGGFPELPLPGAANRRADATSLGVASAGPWQPSWLVECLLVFALSVVALFLRTYALTELPHFFDLEMMVSMFESRTLYGLRSFVNWGLLANSGGIIHLLPKMFLFDLFGTSIYSLRLSGVLFGVAAVPLFYWLVRRLAGVGPALASTVLFITAPEQLSWTRTENTHFAPIACLALITVHLGVWMVERLSVAAVLASALWMPVTRFFYASGIVMFVYPVVLAGHAAVFVRGAWRKLWYVVPLVAAGVALWVSSYSLLYFCMGNGHWRFINPADVYGAVAWRKQGEFRGASLVQLVGLQAVSMSENLAGVVKSFTYRVPGFSHWYQRVELSPGHPTLINVGLVVMGLLGLGYLLGQLYDRRAFVLLLWAALAVLPGIMSPDPAARRIGLLFPALEAVAGIMVGVAVRVVRLSGGRALAWLAGVIGGLAIVAVSWAGMASYFLLPIGPTFLDGPIKFVRPLLEHSDVIFHNLDPNVFVSMVFSDSEHFLKPGETPGVEAVKPNEWLSKALDPRCSFKDQIYGAMFPPRRIQKLRAAYNPQRVTFLLGDLPYDQRQIDLLRGLFPQASVQRYQQPQQDINMRLVAITVERAAIDALHSPSLSMAAGAADTKALETGLLAGVRLHRVHSADAAAGAGVVVRGGLQIVHDGWYRFTVEPACAVATLAIDRRPAAATEVPMAAGVHAFELTLPAASACRLPLHVLMASSGKSPIALAPDRFVAPIVAALPDAQAPPIVPYAGYGAATQVSHLRGTPVDFAVGAHGEVSVLLRDGVQWGVQRLAPDGQVVADWQLHLATGETPLTISAAADGVTALTSDKAILLYGPSGRQITKWDMPWGWTTELAFWHRDRALKAMGDRSAIAVLDRNGKLQQTWSTFTGGPGKFAGPTTVCVARDGDVVVIEEDGHALLFQGADGQWPPRLVRSFRIAFSSLPAHPRGCAFDGSDRIVVPDPPKATPLVYDRDGERMMAVSPQRDLSTKGFAPVLRVGAGEDRLYVLDGVGRLWSVAH